MIETRNLYTDVKIPKTSGYLGKNPPLTLPGRKLVPYTERKKKEKLPDDKDYLPIKTTADSSRNLGRCRSFTELSI